MPKVSFDATIEGAGLTNGDAGHTSDLNSLVAPALPGIKFEQRLA